MELFKKELLLVDFTIRVYLGGIHMPCICKQLQLEWNLVGILKFYMAE